MLNNNSSKRKISKSNSSKRKTLKSNSSKSVEQTIIKKGLDLVTPPSRMLHWKEKRCLKKVTTTCKGDKQIQQYRPNTNKLFIF